MDGEVKPGAQLGKYRLERLLGRGGMGEVWEAHDPDLDRKVALKLLHARIAGRDDARARFQREGRAMARLRHPNVIAVHDATFSGNRGVIAMELVNGENLASWAAKPREPKEIVRVIVAAGRGLAAAHAAGMVHRDFKPHNVLIDRDGRVLVTDFGLARSKDVAEEAPMDPAGFERTDPPEKMRSWAAEDPALDATAAPGSLDATAAPGSLDSTAAPGSLDSTAAPGSLDATAAPGPFDATATPSLAERTPEPREVGARGPSPLAPTVGTDVPSLRGAGSEARPKIRSAESAARAKDQLATPLTETGSLLGTPAYMAPEQIAGERVDERSDVFAFSVTAWELFTGVRPFPAESLDDILVAVKAQTPTSEEKVPRSLRPILRRGFAWDAKARWQKIEHLLAAIERAWGRPKRLAIGGGVVLGAGAIVAAVLGTRGAAPAAAICADPEALVSTAWSPEIRADFEKQLAGKPYKDSTITFFDRWRRVWTATYVENCKKPKDPEFGPRRECLESIRDEVAIISERSETLPPEMWSIPDLPRLFPPPETCALSPRSLSPAPPAPEVRDEVARIRVSLASKRVPIFTQSIVALGVDTKPEIDAANATGYKPVIVEALLVSALAEYAKALSNDAVPTCREFDAALELGDSIGYDRMVVETLTLVHECIEAHDGREAEAATVFARLVRITERTSNPFQRAIIDLKLAGDADDEGKAELALEKSQRARAVMTELGVDMWAARAAMGEFDALNARHGPGDLEQAAALLDDQADRSRLPAAMHQRLRTRNAWHRGISSVPVLKAEKDTVSIRVTALANGAPVVGARIGTSETAIADAREQPLLAHAVDRGAIAASGADGTVEIAARRGALVIARTGDAMGVAVVPAKGADLAITLAPAALVRGTTTGVHDRPASDPSTYAERATRRRLSGVVFATEVGGVLFQIHAPVMADGTWSAFVPPGTYLVALQSQSGLDLQGVQRIVTVASAMELPRLALETSPKILEVLVRSKAAKSALVYASRPGEKLPATWAQLAAAMRASPTVSAADLVGARVEDGDTKGSDRITRVVLPGAPSIACAAPGWTVDVDEPMSLPTGSDETPPLCVDVPVDSTRVLIVGR
ncbi:MAG: protein kinase domain-containing protein [Kofleriaceae bacterium]